MASWTLWQPLVPRYQLTAKEFTVEEIPTIRPRSSPTSPRHRVATSTNTTAGTHNNHRTRTPGASGRVHTPRTSNSSNDKARVRGEEFDPDCGKATMYFTMTSPIHTASEAHSIVIGPAFPRRRTPYIDNFKQQQRINCTRQNLEDPSTASPRHKTQSPRQRTPRQMAQFPVTQMNNQPDTNSQQNGHSGSKDKPRARTAVGGSTSRSTTTVAPPPKRLSIKSAGPVRKEKQLSVNTIRPFDAPKPFLKNALYKDPSSSPRRYAVRKLDDATMFMDDDKIIFIKKRTTKNDVISSQHNTYDNDEPNYIKHIRKLYLSEPRDIVKFMKAPVVKKTDVTRERLEYDLKTDHILNYYSRVDDKHDANRWAMAMDESRSNRTPCTTPRSAGGIRRTDSARKRSSNNSSPSRSARSREERRPVSARSVAQSDGNHINHDSLSDWNVFLKLNSQSILHERQFYLQTPTVGMDNADGTQDLKDLPCDNHECRLCRLEQEMKQINSETVMKGELIEEPRIPEVTKEPIQALETRTETDDMTLKPNNINEHDSKGLEKSEKQRKPQVRTVSTSTRLSFDENASIEDSDKRALDQLGPAPKVINVDLNLRLQSTSQTSLNCEDKATDSTIQQNAGVLPSSAASVTHPSPTDGGHSRAGDESRGNEVNGYDDERGHL